MPAVRSDSVPVSSGQRRDNHGGYRRRILSRLWAFSMTDVIFAPFRSLRASLKSRALDIADRFKSNTSFKMMTHTMKKTRLSFVRLERLSFWGILLVLKNSVGIRDELA